MDGVNALTSQFGHQIGFHYCIANLLRHRDLASRPLSYCSSSFHWSDIAKLCDHIHPLPYAPIIISAYITSFIISKYVQSVSA